MGGLDLRLRDARARLRSFRWAAGGVAATEFAFIAPILIFFYLGMAETCQLIMAQRRVSHASAALADLITQDTQIDAAEMLEIFEAGCTILEPFPVHGQKMRIRITSVKRPPTGTQNKVHWSVHNRRGYSDLAANSDINVATSLPNPGDSVVMTEVAYTFKSSVGFLLDTHTLTHKAEMRPRRSQDVGYTAPAATPASMHCSG